MSKKTIFIFVVVVFIPLLLYLFVFHGPFSRNSNDWGQFGSYIGGTLGSVGLFVLAYSIYQSSIQFKLQAQDQLFYKFLDTQQQRIVNFSLTSQEEKNIQSYEVLN